MTILVPPGPLVLHGTIGSIFVAVLIFGGEGVVVVGRQGITCSEGKVA